MLDDKTLVPPLKARAILTSKTGRKWCINTCAFPSTYPILVNPVRVKRNVPSLWWNWLKNFRFQMNLCSLMTFESFIFHASLKHSSLKEREQHLLLPIPADKVGGVRRLGELMRDLVSRPSFWQLLLLYGVHLDCGLKNTLSISPPSTSLVPSSESSQCCRVDYNFVDCVLVF